MTGSGKSIFKSASNSYGAEDYENAALEVIARTGMTIPETDNESSAESPLVDTPSGDETRDNEDSVEEPILQSHSYGSETDGNYDKGDN